VQISASLRRLERMILDAIARDTPLDDAAFDQLARMVFAAQYAANAPYRRYCDLLGRAPATVSTWQEIPAVPATAFKTLTLACFPVKRAALVFTTSGTTQGQGKQGTHYLLTPRLYEASLLRHFAAMVLPDGARLPMLVLAPSPEDAPHSSLSYMFGTIARTLAPETTYYVDKRGLDAEALARDLALVEAQGTPVLLAGTAFAFVHFLDYCHERGLRFALPPRSRLMDTGGFKGRSREVPRDELYARYAETFGIAPQYLVNEYGMTELGAQFYDATLLDHHLRRRGPLRKLAPHWCRVSILDPETLTPVPPGQTGVLRFFDLTNLYSVAAIQTEDLGRAVVDSLDGGFDVLGRAQGAEARGCSIALDDLLLAQRQ
jgi:hypothetical protein